MKSALAGTLERARSTFSTISLGQKVVIGLLLVGLLLGGFFFFRWITAPTQAPLFSNLASADASAIVDELNAAGVAYELADGGQTIMVAKDSVYDPTHPLADGEGYVKYPDIDLGDQMTELIMAQRGYQANLAVVERATNAYQAALQLGKR